MIKEKEEKFTLSGVFLKAKDYVDTKLRIFQLNLTNRSARLLSGVLVDLIKVVFCLFILFFFSLALGFFLSELLGSSALGFLATGGIFGILLTLVFVFEKRMERMLINRSIKKILEKWYDANDEIDDETLQS